MKKALSGFALTVTAVALLPATAGAATITPNSNLDSDFALPADCTLREAVDVAVANTPLDVLQANGCTRIDNGNARDTIILTMNFNLTNPTTNEDGNGNGDLDIGGGGPITITSSNSFDRLVASALDDRMVELTSVASDLTIDNIDFGTAGNLPAEDGGVIQAENAGNDLTIMNAEISGGNSDINATNGGVLYANGAGTNVTITKSEIVGGNASSQGGGVMLDGTSGPHTISGSTFQANTATAPNVAAMDAQAGAIFNNAGTLTITDSEIFDNHAAAPVLASHTRGGAIMSFGPLTIRRSLISDNDAISQNAAGQELGGGIYAADPAVTIINSTIEGNTVGNVAADDAQGGGIYITGGDSVTASHVTFLGNNSVSTDADDGDHVQNGGSFSYEASIIPGGGGINICEGGGGFISGGYNALSPDAPLECDDSGTGDTTAGPIFPGGATLANNGGPTRTIAISSASTAANIEPALDCAASSEGQDQRGLGRPQGANCEAGAYEICETAGGPMPQCPPLPPVVTPPITLAPITAAPTTTTATKKKCKKGRKLKKGKCKKKKKKK